MPDDINRGPTPDYENPPVVETVLGVQFERLPNFTNGHLGAFWKSLDTDEWPSTQNAPSLPPRFERFGDSERWGGGLQVQLTQYPSSRLQIKNKAGDRMIQLQNGRFHFNWIDQEDGSYPRYDNVQEGFATSVQQFIDFVDREKAGEFRPNQWEVTYINVIPAGTVWESPSDWEFFRPLGSVPSIAGLVRGESFTGEWHFVIPEQRGRLHAKWQHGKRSEADQDDEEVVRLELTARGAVEEAGSDIASILEGLDLGHKTIVCAFREFMSAEANKYWGLKDAASI